MKDSELVEKVAREVMGWEPTPNHWWIINPKDNFSQHRYRTFYPLTDANDTQMVKDKLREIGWPVIVRIYQSHIHVSVYYGTSTEVIDVFADTEARAICEAALKAVEGKDEQ